MIERSRTYDAFDSKWSTQKQPVAVVMQKHKEIVNSLKRSNASPHAAERKPNNNDISHVSEPVSVSAEPKSAKPTTNSLSYRMQHKAMETSQTQTFYAADQNSNLFRKGSVPYPAHQH